VKSITPELAAHLAGDSITICKLWKVTRRDSTVMGFTDLDRDIQYDDGADNITYAAITGMDASATEQNSDMSVSNAEITAFLSSDSITDTDIRAGIYNYAQLEVRIVNYNDLTMGDLKVLKGTFGQVTMMNGQFTVEARGLAFYLSTIIGQTFGPQCRADLGDARCTIDLSSLTQTGTVTAVTNLKNFTASGLSAVAGYFSGGVITWTSADNSGYSMEVSTWDGTDAISLFLSMAFPIQVGDTFTIEPGCDKSIATCQTKFVNIVNFRGEPFIPGQDAILDYPNATH